MDAWGDGDNGACHVAGNDQRPLVAHVIFRLDYGGLENGLVNLVNGLPEYKYRHAIICIDRVSNLRSRIEKSDVLLISIKKKPGRDIGALVKLYRVFRRLRPAIVHTRNLGALDALLPAVLAGVKVRVHGEHGWDISNVDSKNRKYRWLRIMHRPLVTQYVALSKQLQVYLEQAIGVDAERISRIPNGVDTKRFRPAVDRGNLRGDLDTLLGSNIILIGTVGRMEPEKDPLTLIRAFCIAVKHTGMRNSRLRLAIVGDGSLRAAGQKLLIESGLNDMAWMPGARHDIPEFLRTLDLFVLPSLAEGISNTVLEAMASGVPVVATRVGGNPELVIDGETGSLLPPSNPELLAKAIEHYAFDKELRGRLGIAGRRRAESVFELDKMINDYDALYRRLMPKEWREPRPSIGGC